MVAVPRIGGSARIVQLEVHDSLAFCLAWPASQLSTRVARELLPDQVPFTDAVQNPRFLALLIEGLRTGHEATLAHAAGDELHEQPRASLSPITGDLMEAARKAGALHTAWSGAGPTAIAFTTSASKGRVIGAMADVLGPSGEVLALDIDTEGLK